MRLRSFFVALGVVAALGWAGVAASGPVDTGQGAPVTKRARRPGGHYAPTFDAALQYFRSGMSRMAQGTALRAVGQPDADLPNLFALLGVIAAAEGDHGLALDYLEMGEGSWFYQRQGYVAHADALTATGRGLEAAELRSSMLLVGERVEGRELTVELEVVDDYRQAGALDLAYEEAWWALAEHPQSVAAHAALAEVLFDLGETDEAEAHLWLAMRWGDSSQRLTLLRTRIALAEDNLVSARTLASEARKKVQRRNEATALWCEVMRRLGQGTDAWQALSLPRMRFVLDPEILAERIKLAHDLGYVADESELLEQARVMYPEHRMVQEAIAYATGS